MGIIEDFSFGAELVSYQPRTPEIGYAQTNGNQPNFTLKEIKSAFPGTQYLGGKDREYILDLDGRTVLLFLQNEKGQIDQLYSPRGFDELKKMTAGVYTQFPEAHSYIRATFGIGIPSEQDIADFQSLNAQNLSEEKRIAKSKEQSVTYSETNFDQNETIGITMGEYAIVDEHSKKNVIGTFGADPCLIVFVRTPQHYCPKSNQVIPATGAVAHLDALTDPSALNVILNQFPSSHELDVSVISGGFDRRSYLKLLDYLKGKNVSLSVDVGNHVRDAVLNVKTGEIMRGTPLDCGENVDLRATVSSLKGKNNFLTKAYSELTPMPTQLGMPVLKVA